MTQLSLDGRDDTRIQVVRQTGYGPNWWASRCAVCKDWLDKYSFSEDETRDLAAGVLEAHVCASGTTR